tara:strand:- start:1755 stop:2144 length:390 start_codon:yes stop_codon:yes gene_type:complete
LKRKPILLFLEKQKVLWESKQISSYSFVQTISCYCITDYTSPKAVVVLDDQIISVNQVPYDSEIHQSILTVNDSFKYIRGGLNQNPASYTVLFDENYGFPNQFYFDYDLQIADEEIGYTFTGFVSQITE